MKAAAIRHVPKRSATREHVPCPWEMKGTLMRTLIEATKDQDVELIDGVKIHLWSDWVTMTPS